MLEHPGDQRPARDVVLDHLEDVALAGGRHPEALEPQQPGVVHRDLAEARAGAAARIGRRRLHADAPHGLRAQLHVGLLPQQLGDRGVPGLREALVQLQDQVADPVRRLVRRRVLALEAQRVEAAAGGAEAVVERPGLPVRERQTPARLGDRDRPQHDQRQDAVAPREILHR